MKIFSKKLPLIFILCFTIFIALVSFSNATTTRTLSNMTDIDLKVEFDGTNITIENLIKGDDFTYDWVITPNRSYAVWDVPAYFTEAKSSISFKVVDINELTIRPYISYKNMIYSGFEYSLSSDGSLFLTNEDDVRTIEKNSSVTRSVTDLVSFAYLIFLLSSVTLFYITPKRFQWITLLLISLSFYLLASFAYILYILYTSFAVFFIANKISDNNTILAEKLLETDDKVIKKEHKVSNKTKNKKLLLQGLVVTLFVLIILKYTNFIILNTNGILGTSIPFVNFIMPLGLSFYTFMLIGYLIDISRDKYKAENNFFKFFLFASFFPHVSQGPIARYDEISDTLFSHKKFSYQNFCFGAQRILWGFFIKLVLADRIAIFVNDIYTDYTNFSWLMLIFACFAFSIQIYADFYSCMEIAIGSAELFGVKLRENFLRPYFATSMPEFWRRWHVSLGTWFKDYVFYPISISKPLMKASVNLRKKYGANITRVLVSIPPILGVWFLTGLWHGASWNFICWGIFHGVIIILSTIFTPYMSNFTKKLGFKHEYYDYKIFQMIKVFVICSIGRIFFRTSSISMAFNFFMSILTLKSPHKLISTAYISLNYFDYLVIIFAICLLLFVSFIQENFGSIRLHIAKLHFPIRFFIWIFLIVATISVGIYGFGTVPIFIYENF